MASIEETCSVCDASFNVLFRYQMEERDESFAFFCSQRCLQRSQLSDFGNGPGAVGCHACAKRFRPSLASQVFYTPEGSRRYACSGVCRGQLLRESQGVRLGEIAAAEMAPPASSPSPFAPPTRSELTSPPSSMPRATVGAPRRIAVFNHKGGTAKTTTSVNLAAGLAAKGYKVLLVDTDSQGNLAVSLGQRCKRSLYHVLVMGMAVEDVCIPVRPGLDLLPSDETIAAAELYLAGRQKRHRLLLERLSPVLDNYDYVVIDCSPSLSLMNQNALLVADSVLVPVACDYLSLVGVRQVIKTIKNINKILRHPVRLWGVLPTFFDSRANICRQALTTLREHFKERCLSPIRVSTKLKEAPAEAKTIFEHAPGQHGAQDYDLLVEAVLRQNSCRRNSESWARGA